MWLRLLGELEVACSVPVWCRVAFLDFGEFEMDTLADVAGSPIEAREDEERCCLAPLFGNEGMQIFYYYAFDSVKY